MDAIGNLVAKSLMNADASFWQTRCRLLETTRAYASEKLSESGLERAMRQRHAESFQQTLEGTREKLLTEAELAHHALEIDNVRAASEWAFSPTGDDAIGIGLTAAFPGGLATTMGRLLHVRC